MKRQHREGNRYLAAGLVMMILLFVAASMITADVSEDSIVVIQTESGVMPVRSGNILMISPLYVTSLNPSTKVADWVRYRVSAGLIDTENVLVRNWRTYNKQAALEDSDYVGGDYDRGHLVALKSVSGSRWAWTANLMDVVAPQKPDLNQGVWLKLEERVRELAKRSEVLVSVGTLYRRSMKRLPNCDEDHMVPSHFWAHIQTESIDDLYLIPQTAKREAALESFLLSGADRQELIDTRFK